MKIWDAKTECCGCTACANACPKNCISMIPDDEGFLYPHINVEECINCKKCISVCPIKKNEHRVHPSMAYVMRTRNEQILNSSSSGGLFSGIASYVLQNKGTLVGVIFDDSFQVQHIVSAEEKEVFKMRGSKYVQSELNDTFSIIQSMLNQDELLCFVGTPCQVEGLKRFLGKEYKTLICIDFVCHGVASPLVWKKYVEELEILHQSKLVEYSFRSKHKGHHNFGTYAKFENGDVYLKDDLSDEKDFMHMAYFNEVCSRPSCHACKFKTVERCSDLTIFDCWSVDKLTDMEDDDKGFSTVLVHTSKGEKIIENIQKEYIFQEVDLNKVIELDGGNAIFSMIPNEKRKEFFEDFRAGVSLEELSLRYFLPKKKIFLVLRKMVVTVLKKLGFFMCFRKVYYKLKQKLYLKGNQ